MTLLELAQKVRQMMKEDYALEVDPCPRADYDRMAKSFKSLFGFELPEAYWTIMSVSNGLKFNGLTIFPVTEHPRFKETLVQFNEDLRENFYEGFVFLGQRDEELYVWDEKRRVYCATEYAGRPIWKEFASAQDLFLFLLNRAVE